MNLRYGPLGKLEFDYAGNVIIIKEPQDVLLVGQDPKLVEAWIKKHYGFLLAQLNKEQTT